MLTFKNDRLRVIATAALLTLFARPAFPDPPTENAGLASAGTATTPTAQDYGPSIRYQPAAVYPRKALEIHATGTVIVLSAVNEQGIVTAARIMKSSGNIDLDNSAYLIAKKTLFHPAIKAGHPYVSQSVQVFKFDPSQGPALPGLPTPKPIE